MVTTVEVKLKTAMVQKNPVIIEVMGPNSLRFHDLRIIIYSVLDGIMVSHVRFWVIGHSMFNL